MTIEEFKDLDETLKIARRMGIRADFSLHRQADDYTITLRGRKNDMVLHIEAKGDTFVSTVTTAKKTDNPYQSIMDRIGPFIAMEKAAIEKELDRLEAAQL